MHEKYLISIVVPVYNVETVLNKCVESLIAQTHNNIEIILVDDGSTDKSGSLCDLWAQKDERIKTIHKINGGLSDARNCGIENSKGDYLLLVDSDDYIEADSCERFLNIALKDDIDFVVGNIREIRENEYRYQRHICFSDGEVTLSKNAVIKLIDSLQWYAPAVMNFYKLDFIKSNNLYFMVGRYYEDLEFLPRIYLTANKVGFLNYDFYNYVLRDNSIMTSLRNAKKVEDACFILNEWKKLIDEIGEDSLKRKLYGMLIKHYLHVCRVQKIKGWRIEGVNLNFALKYSLNLKEKFKAIMFNLIPSMYISGEAE